MLKIQYITNSEHQIKAFECSSFSSPKALDSYDVNIINMDYEELWTCERSNSLDFRHIAARNDFISLCDMINNSKKSVQILVLPSNLNILFDFRQNCSELKNEIPFLRSCIYQYFHFSFLIGFESNKTVVGKTELSSDFYFKTGEAVTKAKDTEKATTIRIGQNVYATFIQLNTQEDINNFINLLGLFQEVESDYPDWLYGLSFDDDDKIKESIKQNEESIKSCEKAIAEGNMKLEENMSYKAMLVESGTKLVEIVFKTLNEMLDIDFSEFEDKKREDFLFKNNGITYIGEIKGVNDGIGNAHISQVDNHKSLYEDYLQSKNLPLETIKKVLIINDQRKKPINEREDIHQNQITKAKKENVLIIRTIDLLKLLELKRKNIIKKEEIFNILETQNSNIQLPKN